MKDFFFEVTSKEWREKLASLLLGKLSSSELDGRTHAEQLFLRWFFNGDVNAGIEYYVSKDRPIPVSLGKAIVEGFDPRRRGRHARPEERALQHASDVACYLAVEISKGDGLKQTAAEERTATAMSLTRQGVHGAWKRAQRSLPPEK